MTRTHTENGENIRLEYERWAKEYQQTYPTQSPFSPFGVQRKPYNQRAPKARVVRMDGIDGRE